MKTKYLVIILFIIVCFYGKANAQLDSSYKNISNDDLYLLIETEDIFLVDIRSKKEYRKGRIFNAYSAPKKADLKLLLEGVDKTENIYIYCVMGVESKTACKYIYKDLGYKNVYNLDGGINRWKKKGFTIDKTKLKKED